MNPETHQTHQNPVAEEAYLLRQQLALQQAQMQQLVTQFEAAKTQYENQIKTGGVSPGLNPVTRLALPPMFEGKQDAKNTVPSWIFQARSYIRVAKDRMPEAELVYQMATRLQGPAASWYRQQSMLHQIEFDSADALILALEKNYLPPLANREARDRLHRLRQLGNVPSYTDSFHELCAQINDLHETERLDRYLRGLKPAIRYQVETAASDGTDTLERAITVATIADRIHAHSHPVTPVRNEARGYARYIPEQTVRGPNDMDLSAFKTSTGQKPWQKLTEAQREFLSKNRGCFYCRKPQAGHLSRECPERIAVHVEGTESRPDVAKEERYSKANSVATTRTDISWAELVSRNKLPRLTLKPRLRVP